MTLGHSACLEVLQHTEEDFNYHWTKDGSRDPIKASGNILPFPLVKEKDLGHYQCQVKKKGGKLVLTTYRALFESKLATYLHNICMHTFVHPHVPLQPQLSKHLRFRSHVYN